MVVYFFFLFALVLLVLFWFDREFSIRGKLIATGVYLVTWVLCVWEPWATVLTQSVFAMGLYFLMYPSGFGQR